MSRMIPFFILSAILGSFFVSAQSQAATFECGGIVDYMNTGSFDENGQPIGEIVLLPKVQVKDDGKIVSFKDKYNHVWNYVMFNRVDSIAQGEEVLLVRLYSEEPRIVLSAAASSDSKVLFAAEARTPEPDLSPTYTCKKIAN
jgi:hypothetical protein